MGPTTAKSYWNLPQHSSYEGIFPKDFKTCLSFELALRRGPQSAKTWPLKKAFKCLLLRTRYVYKKGNPARNLIGSDFPDLRWLWFLSRPNLNGFYPNVAHMKALSPLSNIL